MLRLADSPAHVQTWRILTTPPLSGEENMAFDLRTLDAVQNGVQAPTLRFFRWSEPTVSYGKHQSVEPILSQIPADWAVVQRPTGGGLDVLAGLCTAFPPASARSISRIAG